MAEDEKGGEGIVPAEPPVVADDGAATDELLKTEVERVLLENEAAFRELVNR
ncbi:hypothetical protein FHR90_000421 [Endobacter medicaginis]|uniref:Uncharacterized protein n=1 Tax=Endobacter medicaginis TaxID=1181271 RepID=A0A839US68_9PROT|nr:hypothetical protein [Endobacter medicaginis]MBB3172607.1 hypothetical protein [Endobacter medicaginis]MCX5476858.1 hypothetical protein [Endobacter medicaginis]NVN29385.1 hypothetical protein [Endobacter medicaginis]